jgi:DNA polymerase V
MNVIILGPLKAGGIKLPFYSFKIPAGFPSPAADHIEQHLSLDEKCNVRAPHVYLAQIQGDSMEGVGMFCGDLVVVDRSVNARQGHIVIAAVNGEPICKRLKRSGENFVLTSENKAYPPRYIMEGDELSIWGVVTHSLREYDHSA